MKKIYPFVLIAFLASCSLPGELEDLEPAAILKQDLSSVEHS